MDTLSTMQHLASMMSRFKSPKKGCYFQRLASEKIHFDRLAAALHRIGENCI